MTNDIDQLPAPGLPRLTKAVALTSLVVLALSYVTNAMDRQVFPVVLPQVSGDSGSRCPKADCWRRSSRWGSAWPGCPRGSCSIGCPARRWCSSVSRSTPASPCSPGSGSASAICSRTARCREWARRMQNAALFSAVGAYFFAHRALAIGSLNFAYGVGGFIGPILGAGLAASFGSWRVPFFVFGAIGVAFVAIIAVFVRRRFTEQVEPADPDRDRYRGRDRRRGTAALLESQHNPARPDRRRGGAGDVRFHRPVSVVPAEAAALRSA